MTIVDVFEHKNKTAVYIEVSTDDIVPDSISSIVVGNEAYKVIEYDVMSSIVGIVSIVVLVDAKDEIKIGQSVVLK